MAELQIPGGDVPRLDFYWDYALFVKIKLDLDDLLIGRSSDCTVQLTGDEVSREHAYFRHENGRYLIEDRSRNGTRLNHKMLKNPTPLKAGDRIYIADYVVIFQPDNAPSEDIDEITVGEIVGVLNASNSQR